MKLGDSTIKMQIVFFSEIYFSKWDTAGQERFKTITSSYYKGSHGIMIVYDVTDPESFKGVENWLAEVDKRASGNVVKLLIGNKADLAGQRKVTYEDGLALAKRWGMGFLETSAKSGTNIKECFQVLTEEIHGKITKTSSMSTSMETPTNKPDKKKFTLGKSMTDEAKNG